MQVEQVDFVSIPTRDVARAVAWYRDVLGLAESDVPILHRRYAPRKRHDQG
jgi:catechol 2,3-dioxygenase-like lactoylglutathione lyase family enzyme